MKSYLNLDLLYNVNTYLFPLFYYKNSDRWEVYSPMTLKSICDHDLSRGDFYNPSYYDYVTFKCKHSYDILTFVKRFIFTKEYTICHENCWRYERCEPFELEKKYISFLKSNKRIN